MVETVRSDTIPFSSATPLSGLYVVGKPSHNNSSIPALPRICFDERDAATDSIIVTRDLSSSNHQTIQCHNLLKSFEFGDIVWLDGRSRRIRTLLSRKSTANTLLVTERCENRCVFCSQPPNEKPDAELYVRAALAILNFNTDEYVGISGGEPTYNERSFRHLLRTLKDYGNKTRLHILSNGRRFSDLSFAKDIADLVEDREVLWGIPLYGHRRGLHDELVAANGAFEETIQGLINLGETGQAIELRIIPTQMNLLNLANIVKFVATQFPSIRIISIMNLEPKGWARKNFGDLYVRVADQNKHLCAAIDAAATAGREIRLFNYPLCLLDIDLREYSCKSISDWKNYYPDECTECKLLDECGGFFASATGQFIEKLEVQR